MYSCITADVVKVCSGTMNTSPAKHCACVTRFIGQIGWVSGKKHISSNPHENGITILLTTCMIDK